MSTLRHPAKWFLDLFRSESGGQVVTEKTLVESSAIWYAVNRIAGDIGKMPFECRRRHPDGRGSDPAITHASWRLLREEANLLQTSCVFTEFLMTQLLLWGNARAAIVRTGNRPTELIPLLSDRTVSVIIGGEKYHITKPDEDDPVRFRDLFFRTIDDPTLAKDFLVLGDADVFHVWGFSWNGVEGISLAEVGKKFGRLELGAQAYAASGMENGFGGSIMLEAPVGMLHDADEAKQFLDMFREQHAKKLGNQSVGLLREGMTHSIVSASNAESEFLPQRKFSRQEVMLWFGLQNIPGDDSNTSYNSLEQQQLDYLASALDRWLCRFEQEAARKLRTQKEKNSGRLFYKFNRATWLATDTATTAEVLSTLVGGEIMTRNEARAKLDMNPSKEPQAEQLLNPNLPDRSRETSSGPAESGDEAAVPKDKPKQDAKSALVLERLECLVELETSRVLEGCKAKNFLEWADSFYSKWGITLLNNGVCPIIAQKMAVGHLADLIDAAGNAKSEAELLDEVKCRSEKWQEELAALLSG